MGAITWFAVVTAIVTVTEAVSPLGRFGPCKNIKALADFETKDMERVWYLQYRPEGKGSASHTCQATYEQATKNLHSFLYYYNKNEPINEPIHAEYAFVEKGKYYGNILVDGKQTKIYWQVLYVDKDCRVTYMCADDKNANPSNDAVFVWTREQCPDESVTERALAKVKQSGQVSCKMEKVEQSKSKCSPLDVYDSLEDPSKFIKTTHTIK